MRLRNTLEVPTSTLYPLYINPRRPTFCMPYRMPYRAFGEGSTRV
jgi:hypothetical protein